MADDDLPPPVSLMKFVSEEQLEEARRTRGVRVEDGTAQRDRSLYEILKENKDKKDAEFNERFKHRPPKALDEEETEFLEKLEMSRKDYEQKVADEDAQELQRFQAAVAAQCTNIHELKETIPPAPKVQDQKLTRRKNPSPNPLGMVIRVKPQAKKAKVDPATSENFRSLEKPNTEEPLNSAKAQNGDNNLSPFANGSLVSYSDESEDDS